MSVSKVSQYRKLIICLTFLNLDDSGFSNYERANLVVLIVTTISVQITFADFMNISVVILLLFIGNLPYLMGLFLTILKKKRDLISFVPEYYY